MSDNNNDILHAFNIESSDQNTISDAPTASSQLNLEHDPMSAIELEIASMGESIEPSSSTTTEPHIDIQEPVKTPLAQKTKLKKKITTFGVTLFGVKYILTSFVIFAVLLVAANYSAYWGIVQSIIFSKDFENTQKGLVESVAAAHIIAREEEQKKIEDGSSSFQHNMHSLSHLVAKANANDMQLSIDITPYENRVVIPKIGKNIPLVEVQQQRVSDITELQDIFMEELERGIVRYPGSAKPGQKGNSFIFGHSSNFPWMAGDYKDVFALLDKLTYDDEVIVYYDQKKYIYKITKKEVISPGEIGVLKQSADDVSEISLMTCWPIGTTLNRLIVIGELVEVQ